MVKEWTDNHPTITQYAQVSHPLCAFSYDQLLRPCPLNTHIIICTHTYRNPSPQPKAGELREGEVTWAGLNQQ